MPTISSVRNVDTLTFFPAAIPFPRMETEYYLRQSVVGILDILSKPKTQLPLLTYGDTTTTTVESICKILKFAIPPAPQAIPTPDSTPTHEQTIPDPKQFPITMPTIIPTMPTFPVRVHRVPIVIPTRPPVQVQSVTLKSPGVGNYPCQKIHASATCLPYPEHLDTWPTPAAHPCSSSIPTGDEFFQPHTGQFN